MAFTFEPREVKCQNTFDAMTITGTCSTWTCTSRREENDFLWVSSIEFFTGSFPAQSSNQTHVIYVAVVCRLNRDVMSTCIGSGACYWIPQGAVEEVTEEDGVKRGRLQLSWKPFPAIQDHRTTFRIFDTSRKPQTTDYLISGRNPNKTETSVDDVILRIAAWRECSQSSQWRE